MIKVYYRLSDKGRRDKKPDYINLKNCLKNFLKHFKNSDITIIADNVEEETFEWLKTQISQYKIIRTNLGNCKSFLYSVQLALDTYSSNNDQIIYFVEDDYLHLHNSEQKLIEPFKYADYITLYDHPDKYTDKPHPNPLVKNGGENTTLYLTKTHHWKLTNSTTMTFATKISILKQDQETMINFCKGNYPLDFPMFCHLIQKCKRKLVSPVPTLATHGQEPWLAKLVDWTGE